MRSKFKQLKKLNDAEFRRLTGVKRETFFKMLGILKTAQKKLRAQGGRKNKLSLPPSTSPVFGVLERVPNLFSYWTVLWCERVNGLVHKPMGRRYAD